MKLAPKYVYLFLGVIVFIVLIFSSRQSSTVLTSSNLGGNELPKDSIHNSFNNQMNEAPGSSNVSDETVRRLNELRINYEKNPADTANLLKYADFLQMAHKQQEAIAIYKKILEIDNQRTDVLFALTFIYYNEGNMKEASYYTRIILDIEPQNVKALYNSGAIEAVKGNKKYAKDIWNKIIKEFPESDTKELARNSLRKLTMKNSE
ncbi:MAG TPA: hypothetical protein VK870_12105 [Ignavibacteriaceae bacterium]|nr:hypothetical protein [Ignavibacteriaceae bacterium]